MCVFRFTLSLSVRLCVSALSVALIGLSRPDLVSAKHPCPAGQFRNSLSGCSPCSTCPINHIVRRPCTRQNDTVCGPFYEFEFFNQRQPRNGSSLGEPPYFSKLGYRLAYNGHLQPDDNFVVMTTTSSSSDEAMTMRCGQPEWRMLCYGLVAVVVVVVSVALTLFGLFTYCRSSIKTIRLDELSGVTRGSGVDDDSSSSSTIVVSRDVRHLEEQLIHNQRRKAFLRWLFGSSAAADRLFSSNDYLDERYRRRFIRMLNGSTVSRGGDAIPLEPYPGMTLTGRTDHRTLPESSGHGSIRQLDSQTKRRRTEDAETEEQNTQPVDERIHLLPQEPSLQLESN